MDCGNPASTPLALRSSIAARRDCKMRSRMGAALVAIQAASTSRLGAGCGLLQDSFHPLDALLDLVDRVRVGQPQVALAGLAECAAGEEGHPTLDQHSVGQLALVLAGLRDVGKDIEGAHGLVAVDAG